MKNACSACLLIFLVLFQIFIVFSGVLHPIGVSGAQMRFSCFRFAPNEFWKNILGLLGLFAARRILPPRTDRVPGNIHLHTAHKLRFEYFRDTWCWVSMTSEIRDVECPWLHLFAFVRKRSRQACKLLFSMWNDAWVRNKRISQVKLKLLVYSKAEELRSHFGKARESGEYLQNRMNDGDVFISHPPRPLLAFFSLFPLGTL